MEYKPDIYDNNPDNSCRFALGTSGLKPLYVIGLNPSTADDKKADPTITKVARFAEQHGFDSFIMLNLYPKRTPYPDKLDENLDQELLRQNIIYVLTYTRRSIEPTFLAAWGGTIQVRPYLKTCLYELVEATGNDTSMWIKIGNLTKSGHPRHPSRAPYAFGLTDFDIASYLTMLY